MLAVTTDYMFTEKIIPHGFTFETEDAGKFVVASMH